MKNELIKITTNEDGKKLVSARELHEFLGLQKRFSVWIEQYIKVDNEYLFLEGEDFTSVLTSTVVNNGAKRELQDYAITINMAKEISMVTKNDKGKQARKYFIQCEKQLKQTQQPQLPQTYLEALKSLVASEEERLRLEEENRELENDNRHKTNVIEGLTEDISLADKRQRITQMIRYGSSNYAERYNLLYKEFNLTYHMDVKRRLENAKERGEVKKSVKLMDYICSEKYLNMTNELFVLCCKVFETEWKNILRDMEHIIKRD